MQARQVFMAMVPFLLFGFLSIIELRNENAEQFARLGSIMVAWAIFFLAMNRERYVDPQRQYERSRLDAYLRFLRERDHDQMETLSLTFDLHSCQLAQHSRKLGLPNPFVEDSDEAVRDHCRDVERRMHASDVPDRSKACIDRLEKAEAKYRNAVTFNESWTRMIWRTEVIVIIWGTLQWGYGDLLVNLVHTSDFQANLEGLVSKVSSWVE